MPVFVTSCGILLREFVKRVRPIERNGAAMNTRGLYTATVSRRTPRKRIQTSDPFSASELKSRMGGYVSRRTYSSAVKQSEDEQKDWVAVYRFKKIGLYGLIARAKFYQTIISVFYVPFQTYKLAVGTCTLSEYFGIVGLAFLAPLVLIGFAQSFNRLVGVISVNPQTDQVRFGYLSFWGSRKDKIVKSDEIISLLDSCYPHDEKAIVKLDFKDGDYLFLLTNNVELVEEDIVKQILGSAEYFNRHLEKSK